MPGRRGSSLKDRDMYEELRDEGASKEKAARISNAAARDGRKAVGRRGGESGDYDDWTVERLRTRASLGIRGGQWLRSMSMSSACLLYTSPSPRDS